VAITEETRFGPSTVCTPWDLLPRRAHLVGMGGSGMRALAEVLDAWGWRVTGSEASPEAAGELREAGFQVALGHAPENVPPDTQLVIASDAVPRGNPEVEHAARQGIPVLSYFDVLGRLSAARRTLAVAGTHGKSTTTAMAARVLAEAGRDLTVFCGAAPPGRLSGGRAGGSDLLLVEACEYRANFLKLQPSCAVILGIEPDHFDCYSTAAELERAFRRFAERVPRDGLLLARADCSTTQRVAAGLECRVETFALDGRADWTARALLPRRGRYRFTLEHRGRGLVEVALRVPGRHNVLNALAAAALAWHEGVAPAQLAAGLTGFRGLKRRLEHRGVWRGVTLLDDYAHHPTEIAAALDAVRRMAPGRSVWCVFQPHQASRTAHLLDGLAETLQNADAVLVADIFRAREGPPQPGEVTAADLAARVRAGGTPCPGVHDQAEITALLRAELRPGDVLVTLGAGDIGRTCHELACWPGRDRAAG